jgi:hypothetical protein
MTFGLTDVDVEYSEADFQNLTTYKLFQQHVRPMLGKENPKVNTKNILKYKCKLVFFVMECFLTIPSLHILWNRFPCLSL